MEWFFGDLWKLWKLLKPWGNISITFPFDIRNFFIGNKKDEWEIVNKQRRQLSDDKFGKWFNFFWWILYLRVRCVGCNQYSMLKFTEISFKLEWLSKLMFLSEVLSIHVNIIFLLQIWASRAFIAMEHNAGNV